MDRSGLSADPFVAGLMEECGAYVMSIEAMGERAALPEASEWRSEDAVKATVFAERKERKRRGGVGDTRRSLMKYK